MAPQRFTIGLDFGTNSVRALVVNVASGAEVATAEAGYSRGDRGVITSSSDPHLARQHPADYHESLVSCIVAVLKQAERNNGFGFSPEKVIGIGVDTTGSTPLPVTASGKALGLEPAFASDPNAYAWLWKDHTASDEADEITRLARKHHPEYLARCGGTYSSEWFWAKILHCRRVAPNVFAAADSWVELCDYIPAQLVGVTSHRQIVRSVCAAGHKALFAEEWGGLPDPAFLDQLHPDLAALRTRLYTDAFASDTCAGTLCEEWAKTLGLPAGIAVAVGAFDVHHGAVGAGIAPGTLVKAIGTSTCDIAVAPRTDNTSTAPAVPGLCGIVNGSALPGYWGIEAGQSAVGDLLNWFVSHVCDGDDSLHAQLTQQAAQLAPGESGLLALDWNNGNRTILIDQKLTGLMLGQTLATTRAQIYRALIEATAFGSHTINLRLRECGVPVQHIVACGGITQKNKLFMQIYADVFGEAVKVTRSPQTCALGAAIFAAVAAGPEAGGYATTGEAQANMATPVQATFTPDPKRHAVYAELYTLYRRLHDSFGVAGHQDALFDVMKTLLAIQKRALAEEGFHA